MQHFATIKGLIKPPNTRNLCYLALPLLILAGLVASPLALKVESATSLRALFHLRGERPTPNNIVITALNSTAHQALKLPPPQTLWPRGTLAQLVTALADNGAKIIVLDIAFKEARNEAGDAALAAAIAQAGNVVLFSYVKRQQYSLPQGLVDIEQVLPPLPRFAEHALASGSFVLPKEHLIHRTNLMPFNQDTEAQPWLIARLFDPSLTLPEPVRQQFYINYYGPARSFKTISADEVLLQPDAISGRFNNTIAYIGYLETAQTEQMDAYRTVFSDAHGVDLSGVEISATVVANLIERSAIRPLQPWYRFATIASMLATLCIALSRLSKWLPLFSVGLLAGIYSLGLYLFSHHFIWLPLTSITLITILFNGLVFAHRHTLQKQNLKRVHDALSQHLPTHAAEKLSRTLVDLEKEHQLVSGVCLVTDIKGYTALAEKMAPALLHDLMNRYYALLVQAVKTNDGFVGNIVGDSLVALWTGANITPQMCAKALHTVEAIRASIASIPDIQQHLPTCFALHAGQFSLGHLGAQGHFEYSPVGDMINTATRVEHMNRTLGTEFLCTEPVANQLNQQPEVSKLLYLGQFKLRNRVQTTGLYTICEIEAIHHQFAHALSEFEHNNTSAAKQLFKTLVDNTEFGPGSYYLQK